MAEIKLKYHSCQTIVSSPSTSVIVLTDVEETRQLTIICNSYTRLELSVRTNVINPANIQFHIDEESQENDANNNFRDDLEGLGDDPAQKLKADKQFTGSKLPEVLCSIIQYMTNMRLGITISNIVNGEYRAAIIDYTSGTRFPLQITDAIILHIANPHIPLTINPTLWKYQSMPFKKDGQGVAMPINTLTVPMLSRALQNAIDDERYEEAKAIKEELDRRTS